MGALEERTAWVAAAVSAVAIAVVVAAAGGRVPPGWLPAAPDAALAAIPHVNAAISLAAIAVILRGWRAILGGRVRRHRRSMGLAVALFVTFLALYLFRLVSIGGAAPFPGPDPIYLAVYLPVLAVHVGLAIVCIPLVTYALLLGLTRPVAALPETRHAQVGRYAASLWIVSFAGGIAVYVLLHLPY